jgi:hypothetical protein
LERIENCWNRRRQGESPKHLYRRQVRLSPSETDSWLLVVMDVRVVMHLLFMLCCGRS